MRLKCSIDLLGCYINCYSFCVQVLLISRTQNHTICDMEVNGMECHQSWMILITLFLCSVVLLHSRGIFGYSICNKSSIKTYCQVQAKISGMLQRVWIQFNQFDQEGIKESLAGSSQIRRRNPDVGKFFSNRLSFEIKD